MLKICPQCRRFYDDADLRFCLNDGAPLIFADENLKPEGREKIRLEKKIRRRKMRLQQIKNIVSVLITTILTIMIISVIVINIWIYLNPEKKEIAKVETPPPQSNTPKFNNKAQGCSESEKSAVKGQIIKRFREDWRKSFQAEEESIKQKRIDELKNNCIGKPDVECLNFVNQTKANLVEKPDKHKIESPDCLTATATVGFEWQLTTEKFPLKTESKQKTFSYRKEENEWKEY